MPKTLGYHLVKSCYGLWLPGDDRGSWPEAWDEEIGFVSPHKLHPGDPARKRMAKERMAHPPLRMTPSMINVVIETITNCIQRSGGGLTVVAASMESTHMHLLIPYVGRDIENTAKWIADQTTKSVHRQTDYQGPVWCKGKWRSFIFEKSHWENTIDYIERHNVRRGLSRAPYSFIS
ncbi:MAG: hypothetical protein IID46_03705 [Planctomycetes bacterium]|nr:hypothetical protein [Planctomycetota bacterium]